MSWTVSLSPRERAEERLTPRNLLRAAGMLRQYGVVVLRGALRRDFVAALHNEYLAHTHNADAATLNKQAKAAAPNPVRKVGDKRFELTLRIAGCFASPTLLANGITGVLAQLLLGHDMELNSFTAVVSHPGARLQHIHRDSALLFAEPETQAGLPAYAVNVALPLIDVDLETGPTGFWPGSHRWPDGDADPRTIAAVPLRRGDCVLLDYRTLHAGLPNRGRLARPILYVVYSRPWFVDDVNHRERIPVNISLDDFARLPEPLRPLLVRGYSYAIRSREGNGIRVHGA